MLVGLAIAYQNYIRNPKAAGGFVQQFGGVYRFVKNKWYFDELYDRIFVRPAIWFGRLFWKRGDEGTIDRFGPHGAAYAVGVGNKITARLQSGYLYSYALVMLLGLIGAASWRSGGLRSDRTALVDAAHRNPADRGPRLPVRQCERSALDRAHRDPHRFRDRRLSLGCVRTLQDRSGSSWRTCRLAEASAGRWASTASHWC
jgi:hypothetical protein